MNLGLKEFKQAQVDGNVPEGWKDAMKQVIIFVFVLAVANTI